MRFYDETRLEIRCVCVSAVCMCARSSQRACVRAYVSAIEVEYGARFSPLGFSIGNRSIHRFPIVSRSMALGIWLLFYFFFFSPFNLLQISACAAEA